MKTVQAGFRLIDEKNPTKKIEQIARICYKSEDKICEGSDFQMIKNLVKRKHMAMMEHADVCIEVSGDVYRFMKVMTDIIKEQVRPDKEAYRCYLRFTDYFELAETEGTVALMQCKRYLISGNMRAWTEAFERLGDMDAIIPEILNAVMDAAGGKEGCLFQYYGGNIQPAAECYGVQDMKVSVKVIDDYSVLSDQERMIHETFTILFTCDRGITHELVRMRESSFAQESTRYCNYSKDKHDNQVSVIDPFFFEKGSEAYLEWEEAMQDAERHYLRLTEELHVPAQQARTVLSHSTCVDIAMTANLREWRHIFELRACDITGPCHPQMSEVMRPCLKEMRKHYEFAFGDLCTPDEVKS